MNIDYTTVLLVATALTGAILLAAKLMRPARSAAPAGVVGSSLAYARALFPIIVAVLVLRSFLFEPYRIPSASMMPGLVDGDFILVDKFSYGLRLPLINDKILPIGQPRRGDVIVFRLPSDPSVHYIKRLVGLPGDRIVVRDNRVSINGTLLPLRADGNYLGGFGYTGSKLDLETLPGATHTIMFAPDRWATDFEGTVPAGHYFFMGDNRNDSEDSRFPQVGFVPDSNLVGRARLIWMNWRIPGWPDLARIGMRIK